MRGPGTLPGSPAKSVRFLSQPTIINPYYAPSPSPPLPSPPLPSPPLPPRPDPRPNRAVLAARWVRRGCFDLSYGQGWRLEMTSCGLSILSVIGTVTVLVRINDRPLSQWPLAISPNTLVSILSTASKAALLLPVSECISQLKWLHMAEGTGEEEGRPTLRGGGRGSSRRPRLLSDMQMFDNASRGPYGALMFFWFARGRGAAHFSAYIGCAIIILVVTYDSFFQQVISYTQRETPLAGVQPTVARSQVYDNGDAPEMDKGALVGIRDECMRPVILGTLYNMIPPPPFKCAAPRCVFPPFTTLGVCSKCADVTRNVTRVCTDRQTAPAGGASLPTHRVCTFRTPMGYQLEATRGGNATGVRRTLVAVSAVYGKPDFSPTLASMALIRLPLRKRNATSNGNSSNVAEDREEPWLANLEAYECTFELCAQLYQNLNVVDGEVDPAGGASITTATLYRNISYTPATLDEAEGKTSSSQERVNASSTISPPPLPTSGGDRLIPYGVIDADFPGDRTFRVHPGDVVNMETILHSVFTLDDSTQEGNGGGGDSSNSNNNNRLALFTARSIPGTMSAMALGMTHKMMGGPNSTAVGGAAYHPQTFVRVQWPWLTLPLGLVAAAYVFLVAVMTRTSLARQTAWKSSLAPLICTAGEGAGEEGREGGRKKVAEGRGKAGKGVTGGNDQTAGVVVGRWDDGRVAGRRGAILKFLRRG